MHDVTKICLSRRFKVYTRPIDFKGTEYKKLV